jgi:O2-independent ubiquinone biosynthesis protein UbiU
MTKISTNVIPFRAASVAFASPMELACTVASMADVEAAVEHGADCIRIDYNAVDTAQGLADSSLARAGLEKGIQYAHDTGCKVVLNLGVTAPVDDWGQARDVIERAVHGGIDVIAFADTALMLYCLARHPDLPLQYAIPDEALSRETINAFQKRFGINRFLLPRVVSLPQLEQMSTGRRTELEVRAFGRHCSIAERRRPLLRSTARPHGLDVVERCAGAETASNASYYSTNGGIDASALWLLPRLQACSVRTIQIEAPLHNTIQTASLTRVWREAIDNCLKDPGRFSVKPSWLAELGNVAPSCSITCRPQEDDGLKAS